MSSDPSVVKVVLELLQQGGLLVVAVFILIGGFRKWWVWGYQLRDMQVERDEMREERNQWRDLALRSTDLMARTTSAVSQQLPTLFTPRTEPTCER